MKIIWNPNPLATVVELDDFDKKLLWHRVKLAQLVETIGEAYFSLDPDHQEWCRTALKERCPTDFVADARGHLDYAYICGDRERNGQSFDAYVSELTDVYAAELASVHCGDCTCVACSCTKCRAEALVEVDTIPGLGKHEASYIGRFFDPNGQPQPTIDEVLAKLADYEPKDVQEWGLPHVDRWREEARCAHEWLVSYKREHFGAQQTKSL
jgi:hypothetical protein